MGPTEWLRHNGRYNHHIRLGAAGRWNRNTILERHLSLRRLLADPRPYGNGGDRMAALYPGAFPDAQPPKGVPHYYSKLAVLKVDNSLATLEDCRDLFLR